MEKTISTRMVKGWGAYREAVLYLSNGIRLDYGTTKTMTKEEFNKKADKAFAHLIENINLAA